LKFNSWPGLYGAPVFKAELQQTAGGDELHLVELFQPEFNDPYHGRRTEAGRERAPLLDAV